MSAEPFLDTNVLVYAFAAGDARSERAERLLSEPLPLTMAAHDAAFRLAREQGFAFHDGLIVAAALEAKCPILCGKGDALSS